MAPCAETRSTSHWAIHFSHWILPTDPLPLSSLVTDGPASYCTPHLTLSCLRAASLSPIHSLGLTEEQCLSSPQALAMPTSHSCNTVPKINTERLNYRATAKIWKKWTSIYVHIYSQKNPGHYSRTPPVPVGTFSTLRSPVACCSLCNATADPPWGF